MVPLFSMDIPGTLEKRAIILIIVAFLVLVLSLRVLGDLERLFLALEWDRALFRSLLRQEQKRSSEAAFLYTATVLKTPDTQATGASS